MFKKVAIIVCAMVFLGVATSLPGIAASGGFGDFGDFGGFSPSTSSNTAAASTTTTTAAPEPAPYSYTIPAEMFELPTDAIYPVMFFPLDIKVTATTPGSSQLQCTPLRAGDVAKKVQNMVGQYFVLPEVLGGKLLKWTPTGCSEATNVVYTANVDGRTFVLSIDKSAYLFQPVFDISSTPDTKGMPQATTSIAVAAVRVVDQLGLLVITNGNTSRLLWSVNNEAMWYFSISGGTPTELMSLASSITKALSWNRRLVPGEFSAATITEITIRQADTRGQTTTKQIKKQDNVWSGDGKEYSAAKVATLINKMSNIAWDGIAAESTDESGLGFYPEKSSLRLELKIQDGSKVIVDIGGTALSEGTGWFVMQSYYVKVNTAPVVGLVGEYSLADLLKAVNDLLK